MANFGAPGLGQLYNGQPKKALAAYVLSLSIYPVLSSSLVLSFPGLIAFLVLVLMLVVVILADAWINARRQIRFELKTYNRWYFYCIIIGLHAFLVTPLIQSFIFPVRGKAYKIPAGSMLPTLEVGDHLYVDLKPYADKSPERGDVIVFIYPEDPSKDFIQRIIGLPGEILEIKDKRVFLNEEQLNDPWGVHFDPKILESEFEKRDNFSPVEVPSGHYFVLGDNRDRSYDSRFWGFVPASSIRGKALYIYWSGDKSRIGMTIQ